MSRTIDMEPRPGPDKAGALQGAQETLGDQDAMDREATLHMELLAKTDAKLHHIDARLDRFSTELTRWGEVVARTEDRIREDVAVARHQNAVSRMRVAACLLVAGLVAGAAYAEWRHVNEGVAQLEASQAVLSDPTSAMAVRPSSLPDELPVESLYPETAPDVLAPAMPPSPDAWPAASNPALQTVEVAAEPWDAGPHDAAAQTSEPTAQMMAEEPGAATDVAAAGPGPSEAPAVQHASEPAGTPQAEATSGEPQPNDAAPASSSRVEEEAGPETIEPTDGRIRM